MFTNLRGGWTETEAERYVLLILASFDSWTEVKLYMKPLLRGRVLHHTDKQRHKEINT